MASQNIFKVKLVQTSLIVAIAGFVIGTILLIVSLWGIYGIAGDPNLASTSAGITKADAKLRQKQQLNNIGDGFLIVGGIGAVVFSASAIYYGRPSNTNN